MWGRLKTQRGVAQFGAFARGARVTAFTRGSGAHVRVIDGGSGYLCEMEPVAHFGLGNDAVSVLEVTWPDGSVWTRPLDPGEMNSVVEVTYPGDGAMRGLASHTQCGKGFAVQKGRVWCSGGGGREVFPGHRAVLPDVELLAELEPLEPRSS
ncbi:hypothetical protein CRUP_019411 [Coryphaenoides rupestris]|nr:hypothetical protein CRUP_019411 [Coryphaenoides rupestris]